MKSASANLITHLGQECTTLAQLIKITRTDGTILGFTNHDQTITHSGTDYEPTYGASPQLSESGDTLATDNGGILGILHSSAITDADIEAGKYDEARVDVYLINWAMPADGVIQLRRGWLGEVTRKDDQFEAELRGLHDMMQRPFGDFYTPECRHDLGDTACGVNLASLTVTGTVTTVTTRVDFIDTGRTEVSSYFDYGKLTWTSGDNNGVSVEIKGYDGSTKAFSLWLPMPNDISIGDTYSVYPGCNKHLSTCRVKFNNLVNFGGFPHVPGIDQALQYPDAQ